MSSLTACGSGSDDADPTANAENVAATENGTQGDSDAGMNAGMNDQPGTDTGGDNGTDGNTDTGGETVTGADGNGSSEPASGGNVAFTGGIVIEKSGKYATAGFQTTNQAVSAQQTQNGIVSSVDSCVVSANSADTNTPVQEDYIPISAGDVITLTSPAGSYAELVKSEVNGFILYGVAGNGSLPGPVPSGTVLDIPGDVFPAFPNVAVPDVAELTNVASSTGNTLTANSTVTWDAASGVGTYMNLSAAYTPSGSDTSTSVFCTVVDDGSFSFPADIAAQMGGDFMALNFNLSRSGSTFVQSGNAQLTVSVLSSNL